MQSKVKVVAEAEPANNTTRRRKGRGVAAWHLAPSQTLYEWLLARSCGGELQGSWSYVPAGRALLRPRGRSSPWRGAGGLGAGLALALADLGKDRAGRASSALVTPSGPARTARRRGARCGRLRRGPHRAARCPRANRRARHRRARGQRRSELGRCVVPHPGQRRATPRPEYAVFGRVSTGMDVVDRIAAAPRGRIRALRSGRARARTWS